jgi:predicted Fe-S protein YdhL (DUF1289 family)
MDAEHEGNLDRFMGQRKWAEMAVWERLDDATKNKILQRKIELRIMHEESQIAIIQHKTETLKILRAAMTKKKR